MYKTFKIHFTGIYLLVGHWWPIYFSDPCVVTLYAVFLIFILPTLPSGMKSGLADTQSNRFCNLSGCWDHKHKNLLNLNYWLCPIAIIGSDKIYRWLVSFIRVTLGDLSLKYRCIYFLLSVHACVISIFHN